MQGSTPYFPRNERKVLLAVVILVVVIGALFFYVGTQFSSTGQDGKDSVSLSSRGDYNRSASSPYYNVPAQRVERFAFDPNTADSVALLRLGLQPWQVRNIYRYRAKGGIYRKPSDFARLYGLTAKQYRELAPYIRISSDYQPASEVYASSESPEKIHRDTLQYPVKLSPGQTVVLNRADTATLKKVPGIGSAWSKAIVNYGLRLGGYCRVSQLQEIEGFPESALSYFRVEHPEIVKIKVNSSTISKLRQHPYINYYQARAICDHIRKNGPLKDIRELSLLPEFPASAIERLSPYLEY